LIGMLPFWDQAINGTLFFLQSKPRISCAFISKLTRKIQPFEKEQQRLRKLLKPPPFAIEPAPTTLPELHQEHLKKFHDIQTTPYPIHKNAERIIVHHNPARFPLKKKYQPLTDEIVQKMQELRNQEPDKYTLLKLARMYDVNPTFVVGRVKCPTQRKEALYQKVKQSAIAIQREKILRKKKLIEWEERMLKREKDERLARKIPRPTKKWKAIIRESMPKESNLGTLPTIRQRIVITSPVYKEPNRELDRYYQQEQVSYNKRHELARKKRAEQKAKEAAVYTSIPEHHPDYIQILKVEKKKVDPKDAEKKEAAEKKKGPKKADDDDDSGPASKKGGGGKKK